MTWRHALAVLALTASACSGHDDKPRIPPDRDRPRRIIEPPSGTVRPLPPHAIRAEGVGPYRLGERLDQLLEQLPSGPRIALFDISNLVHRSLIRAEDDTVLIGAPEPTGTASFVAVIGPEVARTESGIHVGSTRAEILHGLGALVDEPDRARDPRLAVTTGLPNLHIVLDGDRATALVVTADPPRPARPAEPPGCVRPTPEKGFGACLTGGGTGEVVEIQDDDVTVHVVDSERSAVVRIPNLVFVAALRNLTEGRDELVAITRTDEVTLRSWSLVAYRFDGNRLVRAIEPTPIYSLSSVNVRWIGAELRDVELYLELESRSDAVEVGGLLTIKAAAKIRDVVAISPIFVPRRHGKVPADVPDAGVPEPIDATPRGKP